MTTSTKLWLHGLGAAAIGAFGTAGGAALVMPEIFNLDSRAGVTHIVKIVVVPVLVAVTGYLAKSPWPAEQLQPGDQLKIDKPSLAPDGSIQADSATLVKGGATNPTQA